MSESLNAAPVSPAAPHFRLRPYVFLVNGASRSALYDLHRRRIFPIPASASWVLERCAEGTVEEMLHAIPDAEDRATALEYLEQFGEMDFGRRHTDVSTLVPFNHSVPEYSWQRLVLLSIDLRTAAEGTAPNWAGVLRVAREKYACKQVAVFVSGVDGRQTYEMAVLEAAAGLRLHHVEIVFPSADVSPEWEALAQRHRFRIALAVAPDHGNATYRRLQAGRVNVRFSPISAPAPITSRQLVCDHDSFRRLRHKSIHSNTLHIASDGTAFPWYLERQHRIGTVTDGDSLRALMGSAELRRVWGFTKDSVEKCSQCEFRYACPNSYTFRENEAVVGSAPVNCDYDPVAGEWRDSGRGLFDEAAAGEHIERTSRYFQTVSHALNPLPEAYVELLDAVVESAVEVLGIARPSATIQYLFYPAIQELQRELAMREGVHVSGLTEYGQPGEAGSTVIRTAFPGHAHEVLHALLLSLNPEPRFFVSEACATLLGACWGTEQDIVQADAALHLEGNVRVTTADGQAVDVDHCLLHDDKGLLIGPLRRQRSVHAVARHLIHTQGAKPYLHAWFDSADESGLPRYFYELGGSFFLWLIETRGQELFRAFYASKQTLRHFEGYYTTDIATLTLEWIQFLGDTN